jgi:hypothetical protein
MFNLVKSLPKLDVGIVDVERVVCVVSVGVVDDKLSDGSDNDGIEGTDNGGRPGVAGLSEGIDGIDGIDGTPTDGIDPI